MAIDVGNKWLIRDENYGGDMYTPSGYEGTLDGVPVVPRIVLLDGGFNETRRVPATAFFNSGSEITFGAASKDGMHFGHVLAKTFSARVKVAYMNYFISGSPCALFIDARLPAPIDDNNEYLQTLFVGVFYIGNIDQGAITNDGCTIQLSDWTNELGNFTWNDTYTKSGTSCYMNVKTIVDNILSNASAEYGSSDYGSVATLYGLDKAAGNYTFRQMLEYIAEFNGRNFIAYDKLEFDDDYAIKCTPRLIFCPADYDYYSQGKATNTVGEKWIDDWSVLPDTTKQSPAIISRFYNVAFKHGETPYDAFRISYTVFGADRPSTAEYPVGGSHVYTINNPLAVNDLGDSGTPHSPFTFLELYLARAGHNYKQFEADVPSNPYLCTGEKIGLMLNGMSLKKYVSAVCEYTYKLNGQTHITCDCNF